MDDRAQCRRRLVVGAGPSWLDDDDPETAPQLGGQPGGGQHGRLDASEERVRLEGLQHQHDVRLAAVEAQGLECAHGGGGRVEIQRRGSGRGSGLALAGHPAQQPGWVLGQEVTVAAGVDLEVGGAVEELLEASSRTVEVGVLHHDHRAGRCERRIALQLGQHLRLGGPSAEQEQRWTRGIEPAAHLLDDGRGGRRAGQIGEPWMLWAVGLDFLVDGDHVSPANDLQPVGEEEGGAAPVGAGLDDQAGLQLLDQLLVDPQVSRVDVQAGAAVPDVVPGPPGRVVVDPLEGSHHGGLHRTADLRRVELLEEGADLPLRRTLAHGGDCTDPPRPLI